MYSSFVLTWECEQLRLIQRDGFEVSFSCLVWILSILDFNSCASVSFGCCHLKIMCLVLAILVTWLMYLLSYHIPNKDWVDYIYIYISFKLSKKEKKKKSPQTNKQQPLSVYKKLKLLLSLPSPGSSCINPAQVSHRLQLICVCVVVFCLGFFNTQPLTRLWT